MSLVTKTIPVTIVIMIVCLLDSRSSDAQIRVGPFGGVNVRVPFVSVDVLPFGGGTRVRAPFTSVRTGFYGGGVYGGYGYHGLDHGYYGPHVGIPVYPVPAYPVPVYSSPIHRAPIYRGPTYSAPLGSLSYEGPSLYRAPGYHHDYVYPQPNPDQDLYPDYRSARPDPSILAPSIQAPSILEPGMIEPNDRLSRSMEPYIGPNALLQSARTLRESLSLRRDDSDIWLDYLNPELIINTLDTNGDPSLLVELLKNYDGLSGNAELSDIWIEPGFRRTHQGLRSMVASGVPTQAASIVPAEPTVDPTTDQSTNNGVSLEPTDAGKNNDQDNRRGNDDTATQELPSPI